MNRLRALVLVALTLLSATVPAAGSAAVAAKPIDSWLLRTSPEIVAVSNVSAGVVRNTFSPKAWVWRRASTYRYLHKPDLDQKQVSSATMRTSYYF